MRVFLNQKGFTLTEMLLVLSITVFLTSFVPPLVVSLKQELEASIFLQSLQEDLLLAQRWAMTRRTAVTFTYFTNIKMYYIRESNGDLIIKRSLPPNISITKGKMNTFNYSFNGMINSFGTMYINVDNEVYRLVINIGRGSFRLYEPA